MKAEETVTSSERETEAFGESLARSLVKDDVVYLRGELGSGKTALVRGVARGLGAREREVASPTFALLHEYCASSGDVVLRHVDLYRLRDDARDLAVLGLPGGVAGAPVCVEWPGDAIRWLLPPSVDVELRADAEDRRRIRVRRLR